MAKSQLGSLDLPHSPTLPPPVTDKHQFPRDDPEQGMYVCWGKDFSEIGKVLPYDESGERRENCEQPDRVIISALLSSFWSTIDDAERVVLETTTVGLTPSTPAVPNCCCSKGSAPYWSNPPFLPRDAMLARY